MHDPRRRCTVAFSATAVLLAFPTAAPAQNNYLDLTTPVDLDLHSSDAKFDTTFDELRSIDATIKDSEQRLKRGRSNARSAEATHKAAVLAANAGGNNDTLASYAALRNAMLKLSAEHSRQTALRYSRLMLLKDMYLKYWPRHVQIVAVGAKDPEFLGQGDPVYYAEWREAGEVTAQRFRIEQRFKEMELWDQVIEKLIADQKVLRGRLKTVQQELDKLSLDYQNQLVDDFIFKTQREILTAVATGAIGGPVGLAVEAGYQTSEAAVYAMSGDGYLKDFSYALPNISDELVTARGLSAGMLQEAEFAAAARRYEDRIPPYAAQALLDLDPNDSEAQAPAGADWEWRSSYRYLKSSTKTVAVGSGKRFSAATIQYLATAEITPTFWQRLTSKFNPGSGNLKANNVRASLIVSALSETTQAAWDNFGETRGSIYLNYALEELDWFTTRNQLVAHRLLTEEVIAQHLAEYEALFDELSNPDADTRNARRKLVPEQHPVIDLAEQPDLKITVRYSDDVRELPLFVVSSSYRVAKGHLPADYEKASDPLRLDWFKDYPNVNSENAHPDHGFRGGERAEVSFQFDYNVNMTTSEPQRIVIYPTEWEDVNSEGASHHRWLFDPDPSTPVTHFDLKTYRWAGLEYHLMGDDHYKLDFATPVKFRLRNGEEERSIRTGEY